ncbi:hypothetical protein [Phenylobacterium sp.]|uniref:hypothetical protein n=1 Tax=Phenylobacterium sp. TaxID=1871053 RepID=UPI003982F58B
MTPDVPEVLAELAQVLMRNAVPGIPDGERAATLGLTAALLSMATESWDAAAHNLVEENRAIRALLGEDGEDGELRLSMLKGANNRLRRGLIAAHIAAELAGDQPRLDAIWAELAASTERRRLSNSPV